MRQKSNHNYTIWDGKIGLYDRLLSLIPRGHKWLRRKSLRRLF
jgi:hypothetical protein